MQNEIKKQYGFIAPEIAPEDYWLGSGKLGSIVLNEKGDWRPYLPLLEHQRKEIETNACVIFGTLSSLEMIHNLLWKTEPNYSDRFTAKISETDPNAGNTPKKVSAAIKEYGTVPEDDWPFAEPLGEYYKDIPQSIKDIGKEWTRNYGYGYEWVDISQLKNALKRSPVGVAVSAWQTNDKGEYVYAGYWNHWCVLVAYDEFDRPIIWDSYDEGLKTLEKDYNFGFPQIYMLNRQKSPIKKWSIWQRVLEILKGFFK